MTRERIQAKLKKVVRQSRWRVPPELRRYVCSNDEIIKRMRRVKGSLADLVIQARRGLNGAAAR
jgi:hypothetical protein